MIMRLKAAGYKTFDQQKQRYVLWKYTENQVGQKFRLVVHLDIIITRENGIREILKLAGERL